MEVIFRPVSVLDKDAFLEISNYYIKNSFAAYREKVVDEERFLTILENIGEYPFFIAEHRDRVIGYGYATPYMPSPEFFHTAVLTYFIHPDFTDMGIGTQLFKLLEEELKSRGVNNLLAHISHLNQPSLNFHKKMGFTERGRLKKVIRKSGKEIDIIWVQKEF